MANVKAFGEDAPSGKRTVFNETTQSDDITTNLNDDYVKGWEVIGDNAPSIQDINAVGYTQGYLISYLYQQGVPAWSSEQGYIKYNMVNFEGKIYSCKTGDETSKCYNKNPKTELGYWKEIGLINQTSDSSIGSSFLVKFSKTINDSNSNSNVIINSNAYELIRTKSDNGFSQVGYYKLYCPKKGVYFLRASITFKLNGSTLSNTEIDRLKTYNNNKIIIYKNGNPIIDTKFSFLFSKINLRYPVSLSGLVELSETDYVSFGFNIDGDTLASKASIIEGSFIGYKI